MVLAAAGRATEQPVQAVVYGANARGLMGAGSVTSLRLVAGPEVEREAMTGAPHEMGTAFLTGAGRLAERGIEAVIHAVIAPALGDPTRLPTMRRALAAALQTADAARLRSVAMPVLGLAADADEDERTVIAENVVEEVVAYLRRGTSRLEQVIIAAGFGDEMVVVDAAIRRARERSWVSRP